MKSTQISPQTFLKIAISAAIAFIVFSWAVGIFFLAYVLLTFHSLENDLHAWAYILLCAPLVIVVLVPIQLARCYRKMRSPRWTIKKS